MPNKYLFVIFLCFVICSCSKVVQQDFPLENSPSIARTRSNDKSFLYIPAMPFQFYQEVSCSSKIVLDTLANGIILEERGDYYLFEGDIVITEKNLPLLEGLGDRAAYRTPGNYYWPMRKVYYRYDSSFVASYQSVAMSAMNMISSVCGISFELANEDTSNYILFMYSPDANNSQIGMVGGEQIINIHSCYTSVIAHEILHALGFFHEHSRADRDNSIIVNFSNIRLNKRHNFRKYTQNYTGTDFGAFDFYSIMLYDSYISDPSFVFDPSVPVMTKLNGSPFNGGTTISSGDERGLRSIYGPPYHRLETQTISVIRDIENYFEEIYEVEKTTCIKFYSSPDCTVRMQTEDPRLITLRNHRQQCSSYNQMYSYTSTQTILVPAGVDSVFVDNYVNLEHYMYSNPLQINTKDYQIVNSHVPAHIL